MEPFNIEPLKGIEPSTCSLRVSCSTAELKRLIWEHKFSVKMVLVQNLRCFSYMRMITRKRAAKILFAALGFWLVESIVLGILLQVICRHHLFRQHD
ncbi:MAG: hypothetical protein H6Q17_2666 [Bacteroidetes bacterium]|nr:hypothetical protein [Bacteroidota bacterium]